MIYVRKKAEHPDSRKILPIYDHTPERKWRHLNTMQYKIYISCCLPRVKDKESRVKTVMPPWVSKHERYTFLFECIAIDLLLATTKNQIKMAKILRYDFNVIKRIMHLSTLRGLSRRNYKSHKFDHLSIDEKSSGRGVLLKILEVPSYFPWWT